MLVRAAVPGVSTAGVAAKKQIADYLAAICEGIHVPSAPQIERLSWLEFALNPFPDLFTMPPGGGFTHSAEFRTVFDADEFYYVLSGELVLNNPETGEVHIARAGGNARPHVLLSHTP